MNTKKYKFNNYCALKRFNLFSLLFKFSNYCALRRFNLFFHCITKCKNISIAKHVARCNKVQNVL